MIRSLAVALGVMVLTVTTVPASAAPPVGSCAALPTWNALRQKLIVANNHVNLVLNNNMWATIVAADGTVCAVAQTGSDNLQSQWLLSREVTSVGV